MQVIQNNIADAIATADVLQDQLDGMQRAANVAALLMATSAAHKTEAQQDAAREAIGYNMGCMRLFADGVLQRAQKIADIAREIMNRYDGGTL